MRSHLIGLHHQQNLAEGAGALPEDLIRRHGNDGAQREDEGVDVGHVQVVGGHRIRDRVGRHLVRLLSCKADHVLWVHLHRIVPQLGFSHCLCSHSVAAVQSLGSCSAASRWLQRCQSVLECSHTFSFLFSAAQSLASRSAVA